ncbi:MAG: HIT domain-containing protein [Candidatus Omnitrophota bacterium]
MDRLWAPWRINYIQGKKIKGCLFCGILKPSGKKDYLIFQTEYSLCLLNIFPYNNGHLMVAPKRHVKDISGLGNAEMLDLMKSLALAQKVLLKVLKPEGFNIGINIGTVSGAGIPGHLHIHIVPRWKGDTNFMPVLGGSKIISQSLDELFKQLRRVVKKEMAEK